MEVVNAHIPTRSLCVKSTAKTSKNPDKDPVLDTTSPNGVSEDTYHLVEHDYVQLPTRFAASSRVRFAACQSKFSGAPV